MKISIILIAVAALFAATPLPAQQPQYPPSNYQPAVLTKEQAQAQAKSQVNGGIVRSILTLEQQFETLSNAITANQQHLTQAEVVAGFGDQFAGQVQQEGALLLRTVIQANKIIGRDDKWLAQPWVQAWLAIYKLDPATGDPLPAQ